MKIISVFILLAKKVIVSYIHLVNSTTAVKINVGLMRIHDRNRMSWMREYTQLPLALN